MLSITFVDTPRVRAANLSGFMRWTTWVLIALLALVQYPLWWGRGGVLKVQELERQVAAQKVSNDLLRERNERLEGEVRDLAKGQQAVEERARYDLGMIRSNEIFVQVEANRQPDSVGAEPRGNAPPSAAPVKTPAP